MTKMILVLSAHTGAGQTTITVNLASTLAHRGKRVLIATRGNNEKLRAWLEHRGEHRGTLLIGSSLVLPNTPEQETGNTKEPSPAVPGVDFWNMADTESIPAALSAVYQYVFLLPARASECESLLSECSQIIVCCSLEKKDAASQVIDLERRLSQLICKPKPIDLVVLNKINTKEWHNNLGYFSRLADHFGYERIADPLPHCERIHDLPLDGRTVWDLNQENLQDAFMRLTEIVESW